MQEWHCPNEPEEHPTKLQRVQYGHLEEGKFVVEEETEIVCVFCHQKADSPQVGTKE
jgi:hypothetical protein